MPLLSAHPAEDGACSGDFLRVVESFGLAGTWSWDFARGEHAWSPGLLRILGISEGDLRPSYTGLLSLVHPEDRAGLAPAADVARQGILRPHTFRVFRPDGSQRTVASRGEVTFAPDGRPLRALGVVIDVSNREVLVRAHAAEQARRRLLFEAARTFSYTMPAYPKVRYPAEVVALTGLPEEALIEDVAQAFVPQERAYWRERRREGYESGRPFVLSPTLILADGTRERFRIVVVPVRDARGGIREWAILNQPALAGQRVPAGPVSRAAEDGIEGSHLRAARGLLDWSMTDLARASGLSLSTVRRLEENADGPGVRRSRQAAAAALRAAGIAFTLLDGVGVAVAQAAGARAGAPFPRPPSG
ncbi:PAS domain-containing protein [Methylobacterium crusticola]|nr:PAS domain-containing protein [Methylobacterium crusticola]